MAVRYNENTKARAVRLVREHRNDYDSEWAAMKAIWPTRNEPRKRCANGCNKPRSTPVRRRGYRVKRSGHCVSYAARTARLKRNGRERLRKAATHFFARECDPPDTADL